MRATHLPTCMLWQRLATFSTITITRIPAWTRALTKTRVLTLMGGVYFTAMKWPCPSRAVPPQACSPHQNGAPRKTLPTAKQLLAKHLSTTGHLSTLGACIHRRISQRRQTLYSATASLIRGTQVESLFPLMTKPSPFTLSSPPTILTYGSQTKLMAKVLPTQDRLRLNGSLSLLTNTKELTSTPK